MASNGRCDGSTGGREPPERKPDLLLLIDGRRLVRVGRRLMDPKDFPPKLSTETDGGLAALREGDTGGLVGDIGMSFVASS